MKKLIPNFRELEASIPGNCQEREFPFIPVEGCIEKYILRGPWNFPMAGILHPQAREIAQLLFLFLLQCNYSSLPITSFVTLWLTSKLLKQIQHSKTTIDYDFVHVFLKRTILPGHIFH